MEEPVSPRTFRLHKFPVTVCHLRVLGQLAMSFASLSERFLGMKDFSAYVPLAQEYLPERAKPLALRIGRVRGLPFGLAAVLLLGLLAVFTTSDTGGPDYGDKTSFELSGPLDLRPLQELCAVRSLTDGLYFQCMENSGNVAEARNSVLLCTRYAIEMGGGLVMPMLRVQIRKGKVGQTSEPTSLNHMFDESYFGKTLAAACPNLKLYKTVNDIPDVQELHKVPDLLDPSQLESSRLPLKFVSKLTKLVNKWIHKQVKLYPTPETPVLVNLKKSTYQWPASQDTLNFWREYGKVLPFHSKYYKLAGKALKALAKVAGPPSEDARLVGGSDLHFLGQYLNDDLTGQGLPKLDLELQMSATFQACSELGITTIYVGTNSIEHAAAAMVAAEAHGLRVYTKWTLLSRSSSRALEAMSEDQQSVIDYLVLQRSTRFVGLESSAVASSIAVSRSAATRNDSVEVVEGDGISLLKKDAWQAEDPNIFLLTEWP